MGVLRVTRLTNKDQDFYPTMGPFLANRIIHKEIGSVPWDDEQKTWFIAWRDDKVVGFAGIVVDKESAVCCSDYAEQQDIVVLESLMRERIKWLKTTGVLVATAVVSPAHFSVYERHGFVVIGEKGRYKKMKKGMKWA